MGMDCAHDLPWCIALVLRLPACTWRGKGVALQYSNTYRSRCKIKVAIMMIIATLISIATQVLKMRTQR